MKSLIEVLNLSAKYLEDRGISRPRREAEELFCHLLKVQRLQLYLDYERPIEDAELVVVQRMLQRRAQREPLQYILGDVEFLDCILKVDNRALIPRPETELLADQVSRALKDQEGTLLDLCTGTGCLAIALKKSCPQLHVIATDKSSKALELAKENAKKNKVEIEFLEGDLLEPLQGRIIDYCISNPPYIAKHEMQNLEPEVLDYEPHSALEGGEDGLDFYRRIHQDLPRHLSAGGRVWLEIGASQGIFLEQYFTSSPWKECRLQQDLAGLDRYIFLVKE